MSAPAPFDPSTVDLAAFLEDIQKLGKEISDGLGEEDLAHLEKIEWFGRAATALGALTCWVAPNPFSAAALSLGRSTRWLLMHHVGHRGYDRVPGTPERLTSKAFATGFRRFLDWPDWIQPEAWKYEHNVLHHSHTGEEADPDIVERNSADVRKYPKPIRYLVLGALALSWRASYYAPTTLDALREQRRRLRPDDKSLPRTVELFGKSYLPYLLFQFIAFPAAYLPLGPWAVFSAAANS